MTLVGRHLDRPTLAQCLRVRRSWHDSLLSLLWSTVELRLGRRALSAVETFYQYTHFIKDLFYHVELWDRYRPIQRPGLLFSHTQSQQ
jgi:hypothetical protein